MNNRIVAVNALLSLAVDDTDTGTFDFYGAENGAQADLRAIEAINTDLEAENVALREALAEIADAYWTLLAVQS